MTTNVTSDDQLIARLLAGEADEREGALARRVLTQRADARGIVLDWVATPASLDVLPDDATQDAMQNATQNATHDAFARIRTTLQATLQATPVARPRRWASWRVPSIVGSAVAAVAVTWAAISLHGTMTHGVTNGVTKSATRVYQSGAGQYTVVRFADGSWARLAPATTLTVTTGSARLSVRSIDTRVVGEAFFHVPHDRERTFRVHAGSTVTRVLGTSFLVRRYDTDRVTRVSVTDGRVAFATVGRDAQHAQAVLAANTMGTVGDSGQIHVTSLPAGDDGKGATEGRLVFRNTPARDAVLEVGRAYGVDLRIADSTLGAQPLNATIPVTTQSLATVIASLSDVLEAHPVRHGDRITLVPGRPAVRRMAVPSSPLRSESSYGR